MYQPLIWAAILRHDPRSLGTALDAEHRERLTNPLIDSVRRDGEPHRDLFRREVLIDQPQAVELSAHTGFDPDEIKKGAEWFDAEIRRVSEKGLKLKAQTAERLRETEIEFGGDSDPPDNGWDQPG